MVNDPRGWVKADGVITVGSPEISTRIRARRLVGGDVLLLVTSRTQVTGSVSVSIRLTAGDFEELVGAL